MLSGDKMIQGAFEYLENVKFNEYLELGYVEPEIEYYYAESRLYVLRNKNTKTYYFVEANSPVDALEKYNLECVERIDG